MARVLSAEMVAELAATVKRPIIFYEGEFASSTVRFHSGIGTVTWDGKTWTGAGSLARLSEIVEPGAIQARGVTVGLNGLKSSLLATVLSQARRSKVCRIWIGFLDADGALVGDPYQAFKGYLDQPKVRDGAAGSDIAIAYESRLIALRRPKKRRFTHEDQKIDYRDDKGFEFVPAVQEWNGKWGSK